MKYPFAFCQGNIIKNEEGAQTNSAYGDVIHTTDFIEARNDKDCHLIEFRFQTKLKLLNKELINILVIRLRSNLMIN